MALMPEGQQPRVSAQRIARRLGIAQDGKPSPEQLSIQSEIRDAIQGILVYANQNIADSRAKSLGMTDLENSLMWFGKAIFAPEDAE